MKKLALLMFMAALALPMMAQGDATVTCATPDVNHVISGYEMAEVIITNNEPGATVFYEASINGELTDIGSFTGDRFSFNVSGVGDHMVKAVAKLDGMADSPEVYHLFTISEGQGPDDPEPPTPAEVVTLVIVDQGGIEHLFTLAKGDDGDFSTTVTLDYVPYGQFYWDPNLSYAENDANRPAVPFYFLIDGMRYGAEDLRPTVLGYAMSNPLDPEAEGFYTVPVGFSYNLGVAFKDGGYYVYAAVSVPVSVDELNAGKTVAGMRYFNMAGQEIAQPAGLTIQVTTYTDGTTSTAKVMK